MSDMFHVYTPAPCMGDDAKFKGEIVLKLPAYEERLEMLADHPELLEDSQQSGSKKKQNMSALQMKTVLAMVKWSYNYYNKVDLVRLADKKKFTSLDDLRYSNDTQAIIQDVAVKLAQGFELGN